MNLGIKNISFNGQMRVYGSKIVNGREGRDFFNWIDTDYVRAIKKRDEGTIIEYNSRDGSCEMFKVSSYGTFSPDFNEVLNAYTAASQNSRIDIHV